MYSRIAADQPHEAKADPDESHAPGNRTVQSHRLPIVTLLFLSPIVSELLFGTTRITTLFVLLPQIGTWGCATLVIRDVARRRSLPGHGLFLFGLALAMAEEWVIQQTSLAPLVGVPPDRIFGRVLGVNWVYFLWALGYESIWVVVIPVQLVDLMFPHHRSEAWLKTRGLVITSCFFLLASFVAWFMWTQVYVPQAFPDSVYRVPTNDDCHWPWRRHRPGPRWAPVDTARRHSR
jgi:hypothetical protein